METAFDISPWGSGDSELRAAIHVAADKFYRENGEVRQPVRERASRRQNQLNRQFPQFAILANEITCCRVAGDDRHEADLSLTAWIVDDAERLLTKIRSWPLESRSCHPSELIDAIREFPPVSRC